MYLFTAFKELTLMSPLRIVICGAGFLGNTYGLHLLF